LKYSALILIIASLAAAGTIQPQLLKEIELSPSTNLTPVFILVRGELDKGWIETATASMTREERQQFVVQALKDRAEVSQAPVLKELAGYGVNTVQDVTPLWLANAVYCEATPAVIRAMAARDDVILVEKGAYENSGLIKPVDIHEPRFGKYGKDVVWSVTKINADDVWSMGYNGKGVIVAILDTGTDYNHPDLHNRMWHDTDAGYHYGYDFYDNDKDPMDDYGHGTHCSGTVLGDGAGGTQTGVAPGATCMALRINYYQGGEKTWVQAMEFGTEHGASVLSMSMGTKPGNSTLRTAEENLLEAGVYHSVAAGNDGPNAGTILSSGDSPPPWFHPDQETHAGKSAVVTVGATNSADEVPDFSSRGPVTIWDDYTTAKPLIDPDVVAPGDDIISTKMGGSGYESQSGTSMATPHVAGVVALMLSANPTLSVARIDSILEITAVNLGSAGKDNTSGAGRIDALKAVKAALQVGIAQDMETAPADLLVSPVSPNPVRSLATVEVYVAQPGNVNIAVFDLAGRVVAVIDSGEIAAGAHSYTWMVPGTVSSGVYFVRVETENAAASSRMVVVR